MADVRPFRGFRYHLDPDDDLGTVIAPPYDVISAAEQQRLYDRSPYNIVRLELGRDEPKDDALNNRYTRAAEDFARWRRDGILQLDLAPAFYLYRQRFTVDGRELARTGVIARVRLEPWEAGVILPHERTMAKPKDDRLRLLRACAANVSPILALYEDKAGTIAGAIERATAAQPVADVADDAGERHTLWMLDDPATCAAITDALATRQLFIADGHHRYETALAYRDESAEVHYGLSPDSAANFVMMTLVAMDDPGLAILPTHRLVRGLERSVLDALPERLGAIWKLRDLESSADAPALLKTLASEKQAAIVVTHEQRWLATLTPAGRKRLSASGEPKSWQQLDVAAVQEGILDAALGIRRDAIATGDSVTYTRDASAALDAVARGEAQVAILLNPTRPQQVRDVARDGGRMPQKSTYFYPKLITGLVIHPLW
jgi:uncharacterized protein (DUF1015 family)